jgi:outer membrane receptor protein involved in Fe transport
MRSIHNFGGSPGANASSNIRAASGEWAIDPKLTLFVTAENLTDVTYQEVRTFATPGRSAYAGLRWRF